MNLHEEKDQNTDVSGKNPLRQLDPSMSPLGAGFFGLGAVFLLYQIGGSILTVAIFGLDLESVDINALRLLTIGGQLLFILFPALLFSKMIYEDVSTVIRFNIPSLRTIGFFTLGMVLLIPLLQTYLYIQNYFIQELALQSEVVNSIKLFFDKLDDIVESAYGNLLNANSFYEASFVVFMVSIVPSICEEVFFRGYVQTSFELRLKPLWAAFITAVFFGIYHFNPYGLVALIALGMYFGFAAYLSNSIFVPVFLHFINNFVAAVAFYVFDTDEFMDSSISDPEAIQTQIISFILLLLMFLIFTIYLKKNYQSLTTKQKKENNDLSEM